MNEVKPKFKVVPFPPHTPYGQRYKVVSEELLHNSIDIPKFTLVGHEGFVVPTTRTMGPRGFINHPKIFKSEQEAERYIAKELN